MKVINNGPEELNHLTDPGNNYDGFIGIEIRGNHSASFPQKPFSIETRNAEGENNNVSILGMPEENDWILLSSYNDKVFFRNMLSSKLFNEMGHYAPKMQLCEVMINDSYQGVYVFSEKIKQDKNRVNISKLNPEENEGDDLSGGYIFSSDIWFEWVPWWQDLNNSWISSYENPHIPNREVHYVYKYPDALDITDAQKTYIQTNVSAFEDALWGDDFRDPLKGFRKYIDVTSFIDYFIVNEFARNNDGFKKSRNFYKDKESIDPLIYAGPVWDFDWAYKDITETSSFINGAGWQHSRGGQPDVASPGWYNRMMQDTLFVEELTNRYFNLRTNVLEETRLFEYIDSLAVVVIDAQNRHYDRWPTLGIPVGTQEIGSQPTTYEGEVLKFKNWISERLSWLDANFPPEADELILALDENLVQTASINIYPNPCTDHLNILIDNNESIETVNIYHLNGRLINSYSNINKYSLLIKTVDFSGMYLIKISLTDGKELVSKFISY